MTIAATCAWFALAGDRDLTGLQPQLWVKVGFVAVAAYFLALAAAAPFALGGRLSRRRSRAK